ncbi:O-antigen ligase family protein [Salsipaludibacter albus]|uniref:O-antigen ligase family protein n=1 Tax=Salsipaludibacter albus TaxID=2849650 RepID=UPI001EE3F334|nr:O-antigen ligase family protein [Salsipaludibacter albus]MBY5161756.1 O-antigen ligase family protein [Salsipaludibacter albus]
MTLSPGIDLRHRVDPGIPALRDVDALLVLGAVFGAGFLVPSIGGDLVIADVFVMAAIVLWLPGLVRGQPRGVLRAVSLPLLIILLGSMLAVLAMGIEVWMVRDLVKDVAAFGSFLAAVTLLRRMGPRGVQAVAGAAAVGTCIVVVMLLAETGLRARGVFPNPNVAAHFLGANLIVLSRAPIPRWLRLPAMVLAVVGLVVTGSFGALMMVTGAFAYLELGAVTSGRVTNRLRLVIPVVVVAAAVLAMVNLPSSTSDSGFNAKHLDRSTTGRMGKWTATVEVVIDHPLGIGPGSNRALGLLPEQQEAHNEYLAYLSERSIVGLVGMVALYGALWRYGRRGGLTRAFVIGCALQSLVRETWHYRHLWLLLALAVVLDERVTGDLAPEVRRIRRRAVARLP